MKKQTNYIKLEHTDPEHNNIFIVNWMAGNTCNYSCSYCPNYLHDGTTPWLSYGVVVDFCNKVISHYSRKKIVFEFTGGEISMWADFIRVAKYLHEKEIDVSILSNGSRTLRWWTEAYPFLKRVHLSYHPEEANKEHFEEIVNFLHDKVSLHVNIMMLPKSFDACYKFANDLQNTYKISVTTQPLLEELNGPLFDYSTEQLRAISEHTSVDTKQVGYRGDMTKIYPNGENKNHSCQYFISAFENSWHNWLCNAGIEQLVVSQDGSIFRGWCMVGDIIGNIKQDTINFPTAPVICTKYECNCNFDIMCTKVKYN